MKTGTSCTTGAICVRSQAKKRGSERQIVESSIRSPRRQPRVEAPSLSGSCGSAACCAPRPDGVSGESLRLSGKRLNPKRLILNLRSGRA